MGRREKMRPFIGGGKNRTENRLQIISVCIYARPNLHCGRFSIITKNSRIDLHWKSFSSYLGLSGNSLPSLKSKMVWTGVPMAKTLAHSSSSWTSGSPPLLSLACNKKLSETKTNNNFFQLNFFTLPIKYLWWTWLTMSSFGHNFLSHFHNWYSMLPNIRFFPQSSYHNFVTHCT